MRPRYRTSLLYSLLTMHVLKVKQKINKPLPEVFSFFERPENLKDITPPKLRFKILTPSPIEMKKGAIIEYSVRPLGFPMYWKTLIKEYDPPNSFIDVQLKGPYSVWHHTHRFYKDGNATIIEDEVKYKIPFGIIGRLVNRLIVRRDLKKIFDYRKEFIDRYFEVDQNK